MYSHSYIHLECFASNQRMRISWVHVRSLGSPLPLLRFLGYPFPPLERTYFLNGPYVISTCSHYRQLNYVRIVKTHWFPSIGTVISISWFCGRRTTLLCCHVVLQIYVHRRVIIAECELHFLLIFCCFILSRIAIMWRTRVNSIGPRVRSLQAN